MLADARKHRIMKFVARVAQLDRASVSEAEGCGFDPRPAHQLSAALKLSFRAVFIGQNGLVNAPDRLTCNAPNFLKLPTPNTHTY